MSTQEKALDKVKDKRKVGRPSSYKPEYCEQIIKYFDVPPYTQQLIKSVSKTGEVVDSWVRIPADLPLVSAFAFKIGVHQTTLNEWAEIHPEFSLALKRAKQKQEEILVVNGLNGSYNSAFGIFTLKNICGYRDKQPDEDRPTSFTFNFQPHQQQAIANASDKWPDTILLEGKEAVER